MSKIRCDCCTCYRRTELSTITKQSKKDFYAENFWLCKYCTVFWNEVLRVPINKKYLDITHEDIISKKKKVRS